MPELSSKEKEELDYLSGLKQLDTQEVIRLSELRHMRSYFYQLNHGWELPDTASEYLSIRGVTPDNSYLFSYGWANFGEFYIGEIVTLDKVFFDFEFEQLASSGVRFDQFRNSTSDRDLCCHRKGVPKGDDLIALEVLLSQQVEKR